MFLHVQISFQVLESGSGDGYDGIFIGLKDLYNNNTFYWDKPRVVLGGFTNWMTVPKRQPDETDENCVVLVFEGFDAKEKGHHILAINNKYFNEFQLLYSLDKTHLYLHVGESMHKKNTLMNILHKDEKTIPRKMEILLSS